MCVKLIFVNLELQPEQRLHDKELAEIVGISRTPVREALKRLEDEGLIESISGSVTCVAPLHLEEAKHAFPVAAALHALASRLAVPLIQESDIEELEFTHKALLAAKSSSPSCGTELVKSWGEILIYETD